ncbi:MAG TPA: PIG-L deacetylase family protein [Bacillales bacterium]|nr:PIG-L deacetylase family protein [Bacillales bacterium]
MKPMKYENQRVLIMAPHADDEIIGCGGVIQKYLQNESAVRVVIASFVYGNYPKYDKEKKQYETYEGSVRRNELEHSHQLIGIQDVRILYSETKSVHYHGKLDALPKIELVSKIEREIEQFQPTVIYLPTKTKHQDHTAVHEAVLTAARPYFWNGSLIVYETDGEFSFQPNFFVPLTEEETRKKAEALKAYGTQTGSVRHPTNPEFLKVKAKFRGQSIYSDFAEAFEIRRLHG